MDGIPEADDIISGRGDRPRYISEMALNESLTGSGVKEPMLDKLAGIENRYEEINRLLLEVGNDYQRAAELNKERIDLEAIVEKSKEYRRDMARLDEAHAVIEF